MTKQDLVRATKEIVAQELEGVTIKDTSVFVDATLQAIQDIMVDGERLHLSGFGTFEVSERAARVGRNPKTSEEIMIPASKAVKFKVSKAFKDVLNA